jgi:hypothetical protein
MSNVKSVLVSGQMPFSVSEHKTALEFLGILNQPSIGLRIQYPSLANSKPNEYGGSTAMYNFTISGEEAVATSFIERMLQALVDAGCDIEHVVVRDIENQQDIRVEIPKPNPQRQFVCDLVVAVDDAEPFETNDLRTYMEEALGISLNDEEAGRFEAGGEDATVSLAVNFHSFKKR